MSKRAPVSGIAGVSLALPVGPLADVLSGEEEISDVSLGTFYVFDKESGPKAQQQRLFAVIDAGRRCRCIHCRC